MSLFFRCLCIVLLLNITIGASAQEDSDKQGVTLRGSLQSDMLLPEEDAAINTGFYNYSFLSNTYLNLQLNSKYVTAGGRLELLTRPLPGFDAEFAGSGLPNLYVTGKLKFIEFTVGNIYDQFGSGFIFRSYEERSLGVDNSLRGGRLVLRPYKGIIFKALGGMQRRYFNYTIENAYGFDFSQGAVWGADLELNLDEWIAPLNKNSWYLLFGASFVSKYQPTQDIARTPLQLLNLPEHVAAGDVRMRLQKGDWNFLLEYAFKANDPSKDNGYIYKNGNAALFSGSYSKRGMSALLQVKRSDNMSFRSVRTDNGIASFINHLPAFSMTHTYALAAMYPYATQPNGEWAFQGNFAYNFKRGSKMGGKYGTLFKLNISHIRSLKKEYTADYDGNEYGSPDYNPMGSDGYVSKFFGIGKDVYYTDINLDFSKKITKEFTLGATYMYQTYNQKVIELKGDMIKSHIGIVDITYRFNKNIAVRGELQYLHTRQDKGDWAYALFEVALFQSLMLSISDTYNVGETNLHYYMGAAAYTWQSHRLQLSYGRNRAGYNCSGGVCRYTPASKGIMISYNVNF